MDLVQGQHFHNKMSQVSRSLVSHQTAGELTLETLSRYTPGVFLTRNNFRVIIGSYKAFRHGGALDP